MTSEEIQQAEELYIRSLDTAISAGDKDLIRRIMASNPGFATQLHEHQEVRRLMRAAERAHFSTGFAQRLTQTIAESHIVVERMVFSIFRKYQLIAAGILVALLVANLFYSEQLTLTAIFGLENTSSDDSLLFDLYSNLTSEL